MHKDYRHYSRPTKNCAVKKIYNIKLDQNELDILIKLLEFSNMDIQRTFKKFNESDYDLKEIYWNYRYNCNQIRKKLLTMKE